MGEREELLSLIRSAFNEGFNEGGREHTTHGGGKTWAESRALKEFTKLSDRLAAKPAEDPERASQDTKLAYTIREGMIETCANIALAIDSGRGNEKEIAKAIRALSTTEEPKR